MPQMMPINWMLSLIYFICIFIIFNLMNYYIYPNSFSLSLLSNKSHFFIKNFFWKW